MTDPDDSELASHKGAADQSDLDAANDSARVDSAKSIVGSKSQPWMKFAGMGIELASFTLGLAGIGYLIDSRRGHATPYAFAFGALIGFGYGMFRFIQKATSGR